MCSEESQRKKGENGESESLRREEPLCREESVRGQPVRGQ